jgi:hypothetical protein
MRIRNVWDGARLIPGLGVAVDPGGVIDAPATWATGALEQVWYWEAADDEARAVVAEHPQWWDHPYVAEVEAAGGKVAARPAPAKKTPKGGDA